MVTMYIVIKLSFNSVFVFILQIVSIITAWISLKECRVVTKV